MDVDLIFKGIATLGAVAVPVGVAWINAKSKDRADKLAVDIGKKHVQQLEQIEKINLSQEKKINVFGSRLESVEDYLRDIKDRLDHHLVDACKEKDFESGIIKATEGEATRLLLNNQSLNPAYRRIISKWGVMMKEFALMYYRGNLRKLEDVEKIENLNEKQIIIKSLYNNYVDSNISVLKIDTKHNKKRFSDLITEQEVYRSFDSLIMTLEINGLSDAEFVNKFRLQVNKFCKLIITSIAVWESMDKPKQIDIT
jgi:hypothetical protein